LFWGAADLLSGGKSRGSIGGVPLARRLANESYEHAMHDPRVKKASRRWAACMRAAGYRYRFPLEANENPAWTELDLRNRPTEDEITTATADADCRVRVNLVGIMYAVERAYQQRALDRHRADVEAAGARLDAMVQRAREVLGESP
jgi:hypothetical protein